MKTKTLQINIFEKRAFTILAIMIFILLGFYGFFISKSIVNVIVREEINNDIVTINSIISDLEFNYISRKDTINKEYAEVVGFKTIVNKKFVNKKSFAKLSIEN